MWFRVSYASPLLETCPCPFRFPLYIMKLIKARAVDEFQDATPTIINLLPHMGSIRHELTFILIASAKPWFYQIYADCFSSFSY